ncbi:sugar phosphate isomerase/epimerase family protein [Kineococcus aurantiacus]|uniref:Inosose dehydratase n=1 Tax=Kineococcus aurantiacus TaxID=37633 RepID=A0A7Y9DIM1_9ACTN|nr:sugar phosphate isomerase/epimerase [Kineococcus aurantiacus]NYD20579.1 inosose dehydratase [Kineococcus aurantiacus]
MPQISSEPQYGVDLVTFYHPGFWGVSTAEEMVAWCAQHPREMWERMLDALAEAGVPWIELTFPPLDFRSALAAFGSVDGVLEAFGARGVRVLSGFLNGTHWGGLSPQEAVAEVAEYAAFLRGTGAGILVLGTPMLAGGPDAPVPAMTADEHRRLLGHLAGVCDAVGASLAEAGIRLAVHTESHSVTVTAEDVRTLMALTDPELVGLCPDSAHLTLSGQDPVALAREFADRVLVSHWKDAAGPFPADLVLDEDVHAVHRRFMRPMGQGVVDWPAWAAVMATTPTAGVRLLELDAAPDPVAELRAARAVAEGLAPVAG